MAKDDDAIIQTHLKRCKLAGSDFSTSQTIMSGSLENALKERRVGNKGKVAFWLKHFIDEVNSRNVYDEKSIKIIEKVTAEFVKKNGRFTYMAAFKKRAKELGGLVKTSKTKGGALARQDSQKLHKQMIKDGDVPPNVSYDEFEKEILKSFKGKLDFTRGSDDAKPSKKQAQKDIDAIKWNKVMAKYKLGKPAVLDLKDLATEIMASSHKSTKAVKIATSILNNAGNAKAKSKDLLTDVNSEVGAALV